MNTVTVLGDGAWGTAIASLLATNGHHVTLWCHHASVAQDIEHNRSNSRYLPGITLSDRITPTTQLSHALRNATVVFEAIPVVHMRDILMQARTWYQPHQTWVVLSKGIEQDTLLLPTQIIDTIFQTIVHSAVLAGPSFALQVAQGHVTAVALAAQDRTTINKVAVLINNDYMRAVPTDDLIGVQVAAACKNVIAVMMGILEGAGYQDNTKALIITQGLYEMALMIAALKGDEKTAYGLAGIGDIVLTGSSGHSKNYTIGKKIGQGSSIDVLSREYMVLPEGINTIASLANIMHAHSLPLPLLQGVCQMVFELGDIQTILTNLLDELR